jgi:hypothetical protein
VQIENKNMIAMYIYIKVQNDVPYMKYLPSLVYRLCLRLSMETNSQVASLLMTSLLLTRLVGLYLRPLVLQLVPTSIIPLYQQSKVYMIKLKDR